MTLFIIIIFGLYFLLLLALIVGWQMIIKQRPVAEAATRLSVTVIIPFRNEAADLPKLIADLVAQQYPANLFSVLFVDDHSTDHSVEILSQALKVQSNFKILTLPKEWSGKKKAIDYGISHSESELIVTTDADCRVSPTWLAAIHLAFCDPEVKLAFGAVKINSSNYFFSALQSLELSSLIGSGAATLGLGFPTMCNGANLAYRRSAYHEVAGFEGNFQVASGDDEFLMRKISVQFPKGISFIRDNDAVVTTQPQARLSDFIQQRLRWAGKWRYNESAFSKPLAFFILVFQIVFLSTIALLLVGKINAVSALILLGTKVVMEFIFLFQVGKFMKQQFSSLSFLVLQFIYPIYVIVIGFLSQWSSYSWKGRTLTNKL